MSRNKQEDLIRATRNGEVRFFRRELWNASVSADGDFYGWREAKGPSDEALKLAELQANKPQQSEPEPEANVTAVEDEMLRPITLYEGYSPFNIEVQPGASLGYTAPKKDKLKEAAQGLTPEQLTVFFDGDTRKFALAIKDELTNGKA